MGAKETRFQMISLGSDRNPIIELTVLDLD